LHIPRRILHIAYRISQISHKAIHTSYIYDDDDDDDDDDDEDYDDDNDDEDEDDNACWWRMVEMLSDEDANDNDDE
jgi:hypothetical protein